MRINQFDLNLYKNTNALHIYISFTGIYIKIFYINSLICSIGPLTHATSNIIISNIAVYKLASDIYNQILQLNYLYVLL